MSQPVAIKGVKSGIVLKLDPSMDFNELLPLIKEKFSASASFFGNAGMALSVEGREVSEAETSKIIEIIEKNTELKIGAVFINDELLEKKFSDALHANGMKNRTESADVARQIGKLTQENEALVEALRNSGSFNSNTAEIFVGNLRSGSSYGAKGSLLILGDVKPGAEVFAGGCIFVLGSLLGNASAGAMGDDRAFVMALNLDPLQVRIADSLAISEDKESGKGKRLSIFRGSQGQSNGPEVAVISNGHIVIKKFDRAFLGSTEFLKAIGTEDKGK